jgi:hypothetical protein
MKIEAVGHALITKDAAGVKAQHLPGDPFDIDDKEAMRLIAANLAKPAVGEPADPPETEEQKAAKKREKLIAAAVKKEIGTAEDLEKLTNEEIQELLKKGKE